MQKTFHCCGFESSDQDEVDPAVGMAHPLCGTPQGDDDHLAADVSTTVAGFLSTLGVCLKCLMCESFSSRDLAVIFDVSILWFIYSEE